MKASRVRMFWKLARLAAFAVIAALFIMFGRGGGGLAHAHDGHDGLDFSIGVDTNADNIDNCSTFSGGTNCAIGLGATFRVRTYLNSLPNAVAGYEGFDVQLNYSGLTLVFNGTSPKSNGAGNWPDCAFPAAGQSAGTVVFGCAIGISSSPSTYTGRLGTVDFTCPNVDGTATITMVHGTAGATSLTE